MSGRVGRPLLAAAAAMAVVLAGCLGVDDTTGVDDDGAMDGSVGESSPDEDQDLTLFQEQFGIIPVDSDATSDWVLMTMEAGPQRPLQGFRWVLEEGQPYFANEEWVLDMEVAVFAPEDGLDNVRQVIVQTFNEDGGRLEFDSSLTRGVWHEVVRSDTGMARYDYGPPWEAGELSGQFYVNYDADPVGRPLYIILAVEATEETEVGVAIRAFRSNEEWEAVAEEGVYGIDALRSRVSSGQPRLLERLGSGQGFLFPFYMDLNYLYGDPSYSMFEGYEGWTEDITFLDQNPPAIDHRPDGAVRSTTMSYGFDAERGWGTTYGVYFNTVGGGVASMDYAVHGTSLRDDQRPVPPYAGPTVPLYLAAANSGVDAFSDLAEAYASGSGALYYYQVVAEGEGGATSSMHVESASATVVTDLTLHGGLHFGATLEELLGMPASQWQDGSF